ncbi:MAG: adenosylcobalamin-dependent ribonucleoside-diphosphate reductase [Thermodesulfobacteriota bacterium]
MYLSENAKKVLKARYLRRDDKGSVIETPEELFGRVAKGVSEAELVYGGSSSARMWEERFFEMLSKLRFLPNSPTLMNAGTPLGQLSACFVLPVDDTIEDIFDAVKNMALIQRTGGGTGFSFSRLRPKGSVVSSTGGESSGPVSFMKIFDSATENIKQGGRRRGANMGVLRVDHPDILEFVTAKLGEGELRNFNLSVGITDVFMKALESGGTYELIDPRSGGVSGSLRAREVFEKISECAWKTGDPGVLFLDTINRAHPLRDLGEIESTNPCGELPLLPNESCNLASVNLSAMLDDKGAAVDWEKLGRHVRDGVRFLDDVIDVNKFPTPEIGSVTRANRKIGLGVMGFAEMLIRLGIPYNSAEAVDYADRLMSFVYDEAFKASAGLAEERGAFPNWEKSDYARQGKRLRNGTLASIAPTGTISIIAGTTSGIEPLFALAYRRKNVLGGETLYEINPVFLEYGTKLGLSPGEFHDRVIREMLEKGGISGVGGVPEDMKRLFVTALDIPYVQHIKMQAAFQMHVDNSVSKTINMPESAGVSEVKDAYLKAYGLGCKGITVFRYGSRSQQVLEIETDEKAFEREYFTRCDPEACRL